MTFVKQDFLCKIIYRAQKVFSFFEHDKTIEKGLNYEKSLSVNKRRIISRLR